MNCFHIKQLDKNNKIYVLIAFCLIIFLTQPAQARIIIPAGSNIINHPAVTHITYKPLFGYQLFGIYVSSEVCNFNGVFDAGWYVTSYWALLFPPKCLKSLNDAMNYAEISMDNWYRYAFSTTNPNDYEIGGFWMPATPPYGTQPFLYTYYSRPIGTIDANHTRRERGENQCGVQEGNPINVATGNKFLKAVDYRAKGSFPLRFTRYYNSLGDQQTLWVNWTADYFQNIDIQQQIAPNGPYDGLVTMTRPDGQVTHFTRTNGIWQSTTDTIGQLSQIGDQWQFVTSSDDIEIYDFTGRLQLIRSRGGITHNLTYQNNKLTTVTDSFGHSISFTYYPDGYIQSITDPQGGIVSYHHDSNFNLIRVEYPDTKTTQYNYGHPIFVNALTSQIDEKNNEYAKWSYDESGRAFSSEHVGGTEKVTITYNSDKTVMIQDALGATRNYTFQKVAGISKFKSVDSNRCTSCNSVESVTYDANGFIASRTDYRGAATNYITNARGLQTSRTEAAGTPNQRTITTEWHSSYRLPTIITEPRKRIDLSYNANGNLLSRTEVDITSSPNQLRTTTFTYNNFGQVLTEDGPRTDVNDITIYEYGLNGNLSKVANALGHITHITSYDDHGNPLSITDPNGMITTLSYDARQRLLTRELATNTPGATTTLFEYDAVGNLTKLTQANGSFLGYRYDDAQRLTEVYDNLNNKIVYTLDLLGNRTTENIYDPNSALTRTQSQVFNSLGQLIRSITASNDITSYGYDVNGNQTTTIDAKLQTITQSYDAFNRLITIIDPQNGVTNPTRYRYDSQDNLIVVADPKGLETTYTYNGYSEILAQISPDTGTFTYTYDNAGNRLSQTDARSIATNYRYDSLNRISVMDYPGIADDISFQYDEILNNNAGIGRLTNITDGSGEYQYQYDIRGNKVRQQWIAKGTTHAYVVNYEYDAANRIIAVTYPSGKTVRYDRNTIGQVSAIQLHQNNQIKTLADQLSYQPFGAMTQINFGNLLNETRQYDLSGRLDQLISGNALNRNYLYDPVGNIQTILESSHASSNQSINYDSLNRLTYANGSYGTLDYSYDSVGNRLSKTQDSQIETYIYPTTNHRLQQRGNVIYAYDANGNTVNNSQFDFAYNATNRLTEVKEGNNTIARYQHNALGQRSLKTIGSTPPNYSALAIEQTIYATSQRDLAQQKQTQASVLIAAATQLDQAATIQQDQATVFKNNALSNRYTASQKESNAAQQEAQAQTLTTQANTYLSQIIEPPNNFAQRIQNIIYNTLANASTTVANIYTNLATTNRNDAQTLRIEADNFDQQAQLLENAANQQLLAAEQSRNQAGSLNADAAQHTQNANAADVLAAEYRVLAQNPPIALTTIAYIYDQNGQLIGEYAEDNSTIREYVYLDNQPLVLVDTDNSLNFYHNDHLGTPQSLTDDNQQIVWEASYTPFGEANIVIETVTNNLRFPGQYYDVESGLHDNYFRDYDPNTGRYVESDPIGLSGGNNTYAFVGANPLLNTDIFGLKMNCVMIRNQYYTYMTCADGANNQHYDTIFREPANNGDPNNPYGPNGLLRPGGPYSLEPRAVDGEIFNIGDPQFTTPGEAVGCVKENNKCRLAIGPHVGTFSLGCPLWPKNQAGRSSRDNFYKRFDDNISSGGTQVWVVEIKI